MARAAAASPPSRPCVMYIETPLDDTTARRRRVEAGVEQRLPPVVVGLEVHRDEAELVGHPVAELLQALPLPCLGPGLVDLEHRELARRARDAAARTCRARRRAARTGRCPRRRAGPRRTGCGPRSRPGSALVPIGCMSPRSRHPSSGAAMARPISSSSRCGGASSSTCSARHSAVRTALLSGASVTTSPSRCRCSPCRPASHSGQGTSERPGT